MRRAGSRRGVLLDLRWQSFPFPATPAYMHSRAQEKRRAGLDTGGNLLYSWIARRGSGLSGERSSYPS